MTKNKEKTAVLLGRRGKWERYGVVDLSSGSESPASGYKESHTIFDGEDGQINTVPFTIGSKTYDYVLFGDDDQLPFEIQKRIMQNMVTSQCQAFNVWACYGQGVRFVDRETKADTHDADIRDFCLRNALHEVFLEQATDMKFFFFSVTKIILSNDHERIVCVRHKESCYCRFVKREGGRIPYVLYGNWRESQPNPNEVEVLPLLDFHDPLGDLEVRMGRKPDPETGKKRQKPRDGKDCVFAIVSRMATPGCQYYPIPYYTAIFRDAWFDIYELIGLGKRYMIKNTSAPRLQIEVHDDYWDSVCDREGITEEPKRKERKKKEMQNLIDFVCGPKNAGKALVSGYYVDPSGHEHPTVRVINLNQNGKKEGGDWADDMQEASNALCFALGVHPNLIGATPGKSQMNNSGSDKRELFTLKQALEKPFHDVMMKPYHVILHYNGWSDKVTVDVPMIQLTTLDENKDAKKVTQQNEDDNDNGNKQE